MADDTVSESKIEDLDVENMKVADLRKKLKDIGLPVTGNKSELVERLQNSILAAKNNAAPNPGELELSSSELDSSLLDDNNKLITSSSTEAEDKDDAKTCDDELSVTSTEKPKEAPVTKSAFIPLKKRVVAQTSAGSSEAPKKKKIVLNRNHIPTPTFIPNKPVEPPKNNVQTDDKSDVAKNRDTKEKITAPVTIKEGANRICLSAAKNISDDERISLRAKRFNIITPPESISKSGKITISAKKDVASSSTSPSSSVSTSKTGSTFTDFQKRAFRFGVNVSKVLKQLDEQQKVLKRKSISAEDQEKKKKRAERFGLL